MMIRMIHLTTPGAAGEPAGTRPAVDYDQTMTFSSYLRFPHLHGDLVTFVAEDDVWIAPLNGGRAWRVSSLQLPARNPRFTPDGKRLVWTLVQAMAQLDKPPATFISQSGSGYYGDAGNTVLREDAPAGSGTLAQICVEWEQAALAAPAGVRVVLPRTGVVFSRSGGALGKLLPLLRLGLGGPFGNGRQFWPWVTLPDVSAAFLFLLGSPVSGPVNVTAPEQADVNTIVAALARALHRPAVLRVPAPVLRTVMPGLGEELLLFSQRMEPAVLAAAGFQWQHGSLEDAARWVAAKDGSA